MRTTAPNQAIRRTVGLSTAIVSSAKAEGRFARLVSSAKAEGRFAILVLVGLLIIGVGVTGPA